MASAETLHIEIVYARPDAQRLVSLCLEAGASVRDAVVCSGLLREFSEIDITRNKIGIFGRLVSPDTLLRDGDRVEIYRALLKDPKDARRERAKHRRDAKESTRT
ncbi:MAG: RnfH family protein [Gammaproteobacteria bacterium]